MLKKGSIIEPSQASHYSQVLLVPKPDGSSRMCINYIALNACTPDVSFLDPILTNSCRMLGIGKLTSGVHALKAPQKNFDTYPK